MDEIGFVEDYLGVKLYPYQRVLLERAKGELLEERERKKAEIKRGRYLQTTASDVRANAGTDTSHQRMVSRGTGKGM